MVTQMPRSSWAKDVQTHEQVMQSVKEFIEYRAANPSDLYGYSWGFTSWDKITHGIQIQPTKELSVIAARPSVGKSSAMMSICLSVADQFREGYPGLEVRIVLLEMTAEACALRLVSQIAGVPATTLKGGNGGLTYMERKRVDKAYERLAGLPIVWMSSGKNVNEIYEFVTAKSRSGRMCGYWALDHIGIVDKAQGRYDNEVTSMGRLSGALKDLAHDHAPGLVLCQLNKSYMLRKDPTLMLTDLYMADKLAQDADNVFGLERPELFVKRAFEEKPEVEVAYMHILKTRDSEGNGAKVPMSFTGKNVMWGDLDQETLEKLESQIAA